MESQDSEWTPPALPLPPQPRTSSASAILREDSWSEDATRTLIEEWGVHFVSADRGHLRQQQWEAVADAVNRRHGSSCTDLQCRNRIGTLKKRYKAEKIRVLGSRRNSYVSPWPFFSTLDALIGDLFPAKNSNPSPPPSPRRPNPKNPQFNLTTVPVRPRSQKRLAIEYPPGPPPPAASYMFRPASDTDTDSEGSRSSGGRREKSVGQNERAYAELAKAVMEFGEKYEKVEKWKQREMVELEKKRMKFTEELEKRKMRGLLEMQAQIRKMMKPKSTSMADNYMMAFYTNTL